MVNRKTKVQALLERVCSEWNAKFPTGTEVHFHPVIGRAEHRVRKTKSEAFILGNHTAVVFLEDERGCVALEACVPTAFLTMGGAA